MGKEDKKKSKGRDLTEQEMLNMGMSREQVAEIMASRQMAPAERKTLEAQEERRRVDLAQKAKTERAMREAAGRESDELHIALNAEEKVARLFLAEQRDHIHDELLKLEAIEKRQVGHLVLERKKRQQEEERLEYMSKIAALDEPQRTAHVDRIKEDAARTLELLEARNEQLRQSQILDEEKSKVALSKMAQTETRLKKLKEAQQELAHAGISLQDEPTRNILNPNTTSEVDSIIDRLQGRDFTVP